MKVAEIANNTAYNQANGFAKLLPDKTDELSLVNIKKQFHI